MDAKKSFEQAVNVTITSTILDNMDDVKSISKKSYAGYVNKIADISLNRLIKEFKSRGIIIVKGRVID